VVALMAEVCAFPRCGYVAKTSAALAAHQKFIHEDPLAPVPKQPSHAGTSHRWRLRDAADHDAAERT
jgi:hypothetical protein